MFRNAFLTALCFLAIPMSISHACSPPPPSPKNEAEIIERADAAASVKITRSDADDPNASQKEVISMQAEVLEVYKGGLSAGATITILSRNHGTCSIFPPSGITRDVLLILEEGGAYYLSTESNFLSPEGWEKLKQGKPAPQ